MGRPVFLSTEWPHFNFWCINLHVLVPPDCVSGLRSSHCPNLYPKLQSSPKQLVGRRCQSRQSLFNRFVAGLNHQGCGIHLLSKKLLYHSLENADMQVVIKNYFLIFRYPKRGPNDLDDLGYPQDLGNLHITDFPQPVRSFTTGLSVSSCPGMSTKRSDPSQMPRSCRRLWGLQEMRRSTTFREPWAGYLGTAVGWSKQMDQRITDAKKDGFEVVLHFFRRILLLYFLGSVLTLIPWFLIEVKRPGMWTQTCKVSF